MAATRQSRSLGKSTNHRWRMAHGGPWWSRSYPGTYPEPYLRPLRDPMFLGRVIAIVNFGHRSVTACSTGPSTVSICHLHVLT